MEGKMNKKTLIIKSQMTNHLGIILPSEDTAIVINKITSISKYDDGMILPFSLQVAFDNRMEMFSWESKRTRNRYFNKILRLIESL
jgi:hypothetical protein